MHGSVEMQSVDYIAASLLDVSNVSLTNFGVVTVLALRVTPNIDALVLAMEGSPSVCTFAR